MQLSMTKGHPMKGGRLIMTRTAITKDSGTGAVDMTSGGTVTGYAATFDREPDSYGDVIMRGAFARTLREWKAKASEGLYIPLLYAHNTDDPRHNIGRVVDAYEDSRGLHVKAEFDADNELAQYARKLAAEGRLYQFSFAYSIRDAAEVQIDGHYAYELRDLDLFEVSLVQIPANQHAVVTDVKGKNLQDGRELAEAKKQGQVILDALDALYAE